MNSNENMQTNDYIYKISNIQIIATIVWNDLKDLVKYVTAVVLNSLRNNTADNSVVAANGPISLELEIENFSTTETVCKFVALQIFAYYIALFGTFLDVKLTKGQLTRTRYIERLDRNVQRCGRTSEINLINFSCCFIVEQIGMLINSTWSAIQEIIL